MAERLIDALVKQAPAPSRGQRLVFDTDIKGFALRVTEKGAKAFVIDYRIEGRQRRLTIGTYPAWSVAAAREEAKKLRRFIDRGEDPMAERHQARSAPTVADLWARYEAEHLPRKAERSQADERSMWAQLILPTLGKMKFVNVTHADVDALHRAITNGTVAKDRKPTRVRANRTIEALRAAFKLAIRWGWRPDNPASGVQRNPEEKRNRYLSREELARLSEALAAHPQRNSANAIKLLMLTGARRGEVLNATWDMFDLEAGIWVKPSAHTKQRREHRIPLSGAAVSLLRELNAYAVGPYVFPGKTSELPLTNVKGTWAAVCKAAGLEDVRIHDLRHSFASILVSSGASLPVIGAMLGHTQVQTTARYAHLYDTPLRDAAERVSAAITQNNLAAD